MAATIEIIDERTNTNTGAIEKLKSIILGNGKKGIVAEVAAITANLFWIKTLLILNLTAIIGLIYRSYTG